jgi:hypothetical protein
MYFWIFYWKQNMMLNPLAGIHLGRGEIVIIMKLGGVLMLQGRKIILWFDLGGGGDKPLPPNHIIYSNSIRFELTEAKTLLMAASSWYSNDPLSMLPLSR